jgi:outer membrane protein assembly factor BamB
VLRLDAPIRHFDACPLTTVQGWDTAADKASWVSPLTYDAAMALAGDPGLVLVVDGTAMTSAPGPSTEMSFCGVSAGQGEMSAYSAADGTQLWSVDLPEAAGVPQFFGEPMFVPSAVVAEIVDDHVVVTFSDWSLSSMGAFVATVGATVAVDLATGTQTLSVAGSPLTGDAAGVLFVASTDLSTITGYDLTKPGAGQLWQVPVPRRSAGGDPADPAAAAPLFGVGDYVAAITDAGLEILR